MVGAHRCLPGPAGSETDASSECDSQAGETADCQVVEPGGECLPPDHQVVEINQLLENSELVRMAAAANAAGEGGDVQIIEPSPTNFDYSRMHKIVEGRAFIRAVDQSYQARVLISKLITKADTKIKELTVLEAEREEGESEDDDY